ncbi:copper chaperone PCu(A)C [Acetobacter fabarum]|jgi:copper(I)-binding protein|uniref:Copper chaperone PCu(A)C n=1 Tax=Acetobacter fabarum TaxID=483199 RepID=A0A269XYS0_9PROT|nr:copper chaperone PCu(A)C [Acetobacter fabarum]MCI1244007.1 copper chaperone PCu(A)C [Acetobacter fabarum]MCI1910001.1 copper chaperone PCu(A)C [Acetobacter fabarum]MCI1928499.1 copper chaperone PCu(A)C [Acetobacter fabarum]MCI1948483.1 copper chaperone PCu(A)C [Acetobacter fabarum]MCI1989506.1 copper chaperone PCu(A)C [Acetobacter fabarum]
MKPRYQAILASALISLLALGPAQAQEHNNGQSVPGQADAQKDISITDISLHQPATQGQGQTELYFSLTNNSHTTHLLTGVVSPACSTLVGYHTDQENTPGTRHLFQHLALPEVTTLVFASAGYHMLCVGPVAQVLTQPNVPVTFQFLGGSSKTVSVPVTSGAR